MAEKKDFMSELAKSIEASKRGETSTMQSIDDFQPRARKTSMETDYDPLAGTQEVPTQPVVEEPQVEEVVIPQAVRQEESPVFEAPKEEPISTRPASFSQETFQKIEKPKRSIPKWVWLALLLGLLLLGFLIYYFFFAPKIVVPDCVGQDISCVTNWAKQNRVESSSLVRNEEYNMEYDNNVVIYQSVDPGKKVKPTTPFTITVSLGPDPEEGIVFPGDLRSMTSDEIKDWIAENKLLKTKVTTQYNDTIPEGHVISYEVKNGSESDFTRGTTLNVVTSKGPAPAGQVTVDNLAGKTISEVETWANQKKVKLEKIETFDDKVDSGKIIASSVPQGQTVREGDTITVTVSKGKGVRIPNVVGYTKEQFEAWKMDKNNSVTVVPKSIYNEAPLGTIIGQNITPGTVVESGAVLEVTESLYLPILETHSREWLGKDYLELKAKIDDFNYKGANIQAGEYGEFAQRTCSDEFPTEGMIINYTCSGGTVDSAGSTHYSAGCERPLNLNARVGYQVSTGPCTVATPSPTVVVLTNGDLYDLQSIVEFSNNHGIIYDQLIPITKDQRDAEWETKNADVCITYNGQKYYGGFDIPFTLVMNKGDHIVVEYVTDTGDAKPTEDPNNN
ncbi:MAG: PASTA domain-containing protein [Solobacterium sp.]|nr:PASTA domain-containing protein [Solobacterium sp.]